MAEQKTSSSSASPLRKRGASTVYRKAILKAIEGLNDFHTRSSIDSIRRHTQDILEDQSWNESLFLLTLKSVVKNGEIDLFPHVSAELSPGYKRKRAESLLERVEAHLVHTPLLPPAHPTPLVVTGEPTKEPPKGRHKEHEKWKIMPKTEYDKSHIVNPMDTH